MAFEYIVFSIYYGMACFGWLIWVSFKGDKRGWTYRKKLLAYLACPIGGIGLISIGLYYVGKWIKDSACKIWNIIWYNDPYITKEEKTRRKDIIKERKKVIRKLKE